MRIVQDSREQTPYAFNAPRYAGVTVEVSTPLHCPGRCVTICRL